MDNKNHINTSNSASDLGLAAISGGGTGTLLIYLAESLPPSNPYRDIFVIIAPSAAVAITSFWVWTMGEINKRRKEKLIKKTLAETAENLHKKIADPSISQKQKKIYEKQLAILDEKSFQRSLKIIDE